MAASTNLCMGGHLAPQLFLLGAQKAGTTLLASTFAQAPGVEHFAALDKGHQKEPHAFDGQIQKRGRDWWLSGYPNCTDELPTTRAVSFDATPMLFLRRVPAAIAAQYSPAVCPLPSCAQRLLFSVVLRKPLDRLRSAFYNWLHAGWNKNWKKSMANCTLQLYADELLRMGRDPINAVWGPYSGSLYPRQLSWWLGERSFNPNQFVIVPFQTLTAPGGAQLVSRALLHRLGLRMPVSLNQVRLHSSVLSRHTCSGSPHAHMPRTRPARSDIAKPETTPRSKLA